MERGNGPPPASKPRWRVTLIPSCREVSLLSSNNMDRPLPWWRRPGYWMHLMFCGLCRRYRRQLQFLGSALHRAPKRFPVQHPLPPQARERIKRALRETPAGSDDCNCPNCRS